MGTLADIFSISNSVDIEQLRNMQTIQLRLAEARERGDAIARATGTPPQGFFAFEKTNPTPREKSDGAQWLGAVIGGAFGAVFGTFYGSRGMAAGAAIGGGLGFVVGLFSKESEESRLNHALGKYDAYLSVMETAIPPTKNTPHVTGPYHANHVDKVLADRQQPEATLAKA